MNELCPLTDRSLVKKCLASGMAEEKAKVRSSELDMGLSSSNNLVGMKVDMAVFVPSDENQQPCGYILIAYCLVYLIEYIPQTY